MAALLPDEFYAHVAAKGAALKTGPVVPHGLFAAYLASGQGDLDSARDTRLGYGLMVYLVDQGDTGFDALHRKAGMHLRAVLRGAGPIQGEVFTFPRDRWHINACEPTIPTVEQALDGAVLGRLDELCDEVVGETPAFEIHFRGLVSSDNTILLCGYADQPLADLRARFYQALARYPQDLGLDPAMVPGLSQVEKNSGTTAPVPVVRLQGQLQDPQTYVTRVQRRRELDLGTVRITQLTFAQHGWHNNPAQRVDRKTYSLR